LTTWLNRPNGGFRAEREKLPSVQLADPALAAVLIGI
jgi:hypothetical protein